MNGKLVLVVFALALAAVSAKPATRLDKAMEEVAEAFRAAATDVVKETADKLKDQAGDLTKQIDSAKDMATDLVNKGTDAAGGGGGGGFIQMIMDAICWLPRAIGLMSPKSPMDKLTNGLGNGNNVGNMLNKVPGVGDALNKVPGVGDAVNAAQKAASDATGGKVRRKRSPQVDAPKPPVAAPAAAGAAAPGAAASAAATGAASNGASAGATPAIANAADSTNAADATTESPGFFQNVLNFLCAPLRWIGLMAPLPSTDAATGNGAANGVANGLVGDVNGDGKATGQDKKVDGATDAKADTKTDAKAPSTRRKRGANDLLNAASNLAGGKGGSNGNLLNTASNLLGGSGGGGSGGLSSALGQASSVLSAVKGEKCVLGWFEWFYTFFGYLPNSCTLANTIGGAMNSVPGLGAVANFAL